MSHQHIEVVLPPNVPIEEGVEAALRRFNENLDDDDESRRYSWWDWYTIGGRWAGAKILSRLGGRQQEFWEKLVSMGVTVSGLQCGKQTLSPASQIPVVDALWREWFPGCGDKCLLFSHAWDQYGKDGIHPADVAPLSESLTVECCRVVFTGYDYQGRLAPTYLVEDDAYNGVNFQKFDWDGTVGAALEMFRKCLSRYKPEWQAKNLPGDDWQVVTVDIHS